MGDKVKEYLVAFLGPLFTWLAALFFLKGRLPEASLEDYFEHLFFWPFVVGLAILFTVDMMLYLNPSFAGAHN